MNLYKYIKFGDSVVSITKMNDREISIPLKIESSEIFSSIKKIGFYLLNNYDEDIDNRRARYCLIIDIDYNFKGSTSIYPVAQEILIDIDYQENRLPKNVYRASDNSLNRIRKEIRQIIREDKIDKICI